MSDSEAELRNVLLTHDGKGQRVKAAALEELLRRAHENVNRELFFQEIVREQAARNGITPAEVIQRAAARVQGALFGNVVLVRQHDFGTDVTVAVTDGLEWEQSQALVAKRYMLVPLEEGA